MNITILGAGTIASALTIPISDNGHRISLWGTEYDQNILRELSAGREHPRLHKTLSTTVRVHQPDELEEALSDSEVVILGVSSQGVVPVLRKASDYLRDNQILLSVAKGVVERENDVYLMGNGIKQVLQDNGMNQLPQLILMAGPSIAAELANRCWTPVDFAGEDQDAVETCCRIANTDYFRIRGSDDVAGTETCLGLKNVYSIALSWPSGLAETREKTSMSNARSFLFMIAMNELERLVQARGGSPETARGRPGLGDFVTTSDSGRNGMFGRLLGKGLKPDEAFKKLQEKGVGVVEGYETGKAARELVEHIPGEDSVPEAYPLLDEICNVLYGGKGVDQAMNDVFNNVESSPLYY
jgi:glycerol-3-phosphate dehydrogenase (NAD(P)+)